MLLTALFVSSCYWQPLPIHSPLSTPYSATIKTFADALNASAPFALWQRPAIIKLMDRCWCDFSSGNLFEPFNLTRWEVLSVERLKDDLEGKVPIGGIGSQSQMGTTTTTNDTAALVAPTSGPTAPHVEKRSTISTLRSTFWKARSPTVSNDLEQHQDTTASPTPPAVEEERHIASGEFDLQPYGFDLILDFRWTRQS